MINHISDFETMVKKRERKSVLGVVAADDDHTLEALAMVVKNTHTRVVLSGSRKKIEDICREKSIDMERFDEIIDTEDLDQAISSIISRVSAGEIDCMMKGLVSTPSLLKAVVNKETGIKKSKVLSHVSILEVANHHKIMAMTDSGMLLYPDYDQKKALIGNAVGLMNMLGYDRPKVAVLAASEELIEKMPETIEGKRLQEENESGQITDCIIEGPMQFDVAYSKEVADYKNMKSQVAGDADIFVVPNITAGNLLGKALIYGANAKMCGLIMGARVPIGLASRGSSVEDKYNTMMISLACS